MHPTNAHAPSANCVTDESHPLSSTQQRLWTIEQLTPGRSDYIIPLVLRLTRKLAVKSLKSAIHAAVARHEALRTTFVAGEAGPRQVVASEGGFEWSTHDLSHVARDEALLHALEEIKADARRPFDLTTGPLLRVCLKRIAADEHVLLLALHHIVADGWSLALLVNDVSAAYRAELGEDTDIATRETTSYSSFARWQRAWMQTPRFRDQMAFWTSELAGVAPLELTLDRPRRPHPSGDGDEIRFPVDATTSGRLRALAQRLGATPFMVLLAAYQLLLARHASQQDIAVASPISDRPRAVDEDTVGFYVNTVVLRARLLRSMTFEDLVRHCRTVALRAYDNAGAPFQEVVSAVAGKRELTRQPLASVMLALDTGPRAQLQLPEVEVDRVPLHTGTCQYDLALFMTDTGDELEGGLEFSTDIFDRSTAERLALDFRRILVSVAEAPRQLLGDVRMLSASERRKVLTASRGGRLTSPVDGSVHHQVFNAAQTHADRLAVVTPRAALTYRELLDRTRAIRAGLAARGVTPQARVALCCTPSPDLVAAILAILDLGATFVAIDPQYPPERQRLICADSLAVAVAVDEGATAPDVAAQFVTTTELVAAGPAAVDDLGHVPAGGSQVAYVAYTSGSTGVPKGIAVTHAGIANYLAWMVGEFDVDACDRTIQLAPVGFDIAVWELLLPLVRGGAVVIPEPSVMTDFAGLRETLHRCEVTIAHLVPQLLQAYLTSVADPLPTSLRHLLTSSDALSPDLARRALAAHRGARLTYFYGVTEVSVESTSVTFATDEVPDTMHAGTPIANTELYVHDALGAVAPVGVAGELCIGGDSVALGYLGRPRETASAFVPDRWRPGRRLYRTGDLGRLDADGNFHFIGRMDDQLNVRGARVEPAEVEAALRSIDDVRQATVVAVETSTGKGLGAAIVLAEPHAADAEDAVLARAAELLPAFMVPRVLRALPSLPLTDHGKVDRAAIARSLAVPVAHGAENPPQGETEELIAEAWSRALGIGSVSRHANFFDLGGDSILAIQIAGALRAHGLSVAPRMLFEHQTVGLLAGAVDELAAGASSDAGAIATSMPSGRHRVPLSPAQQWFFDQHRPNPSHYALTLALDVTDRRVTRDAVVAVLKALVSHHDALRLRFVRARNGWEQSLLGAAEASKDAAGHVVELPSPIDTEAAFSRAVTDLHCSLDITDGPVVRAGYVARGAEGRAMIVLSVHHLVADAVSLDVLAADLDAGLAQHAVGKPIALEPPTGSFAAWTQALDDRAQELDRRSLAQAGNGARPLVTLPRDHEDGPNVIATLGTTTRRLSADQTQRLWEQGGRSSRRGADPVLTVLLAGLATAIAEWSEHACVGVDVESHGRSFALDDVDLTRSVGWFTSIAPICVDVDGKRFDDVQDSVRLRLGALNGDADALALARSYRPELVDNTDTQRPEICLNYLGRAGFGRGEMVTEAGAEIGETEPGSAVRPYLFEVLAEIRGGALEILWRYSRAVHRDETVAALADRLVDLVRRAGTANPTDAARGQRARLRLDLANLDESELARVLEGTTGSI